MVWAAGYAKVRLVADFQREEEKIRTSIIPRIS